MLKRKDKRIKGCWNPKCKRCKKHYKYKANENYCSLCKSELVYVCATCGGLLEDAGRKHRVCNRCLAGREESAEARKKATASVLSAAAAVGNVVADKVRKN